MTNYLLSIDPSIKNTGFTLWEKENISDNFIIRWKPIFVKSYNLKEYNGKRQFYWDIKVNDNELDLIIERGTFHVKNGIGYETQEHLRGFIAGQFNKLITKNMLISPSSWKKWYVNNLKNNFNLPKKQEFIWIKNTSIQLANELINEQNWNITISNHDEADSLLIGWYYLNKENK
ncbi:hypothetical protein [Spiroplasma endosymbiont of Tricholauxania praeusta]|uniref:hypothetical protein n=1 Tax=Spiroplasma endosymbiont of Tricholauxania praeusta TaxID=3066296 RepID=UPI0030CE8A62